MKPIVLVLAIVCPLALVAALAVGFFVVTSRARDAGIAFAAPAPALAAAPSAPTISAEELRTLRAELDMVSGRVAELENEISHLRDEATRTPVDDGTVLDASTDHALSAASIGLSAPQREAVLQVLTEERARQEKERADQRAARDLAEIERRADQVAKQLGLNAHDRTSLVGFYSEANKKRDEMMAQMQNGEFDRDTARQSFEDMRTWSSTELTRLFGQTLGDQILALERDRRGGWNDRGGRGGDVGFRGTTNQGAPGGQR